MVDRYTKVVLTVIAATLLWLCLWGPGPHMWGAPAEAQGGTADVNIAKVGGKALQVGYGTSFSGVSSVQGLPVEVRGVEGSITQLYPVKVSISR